MKVCFKCQKELPISEFYRHRMMADGYLGKCKSCAKIDVSDHRKKNIHRIRAYDRSRGCRQTKEYRDGYKLKFPRKYYAHTLVNNSIRDKKLFNEPCQQCGSDKSIHAHHDDYMMPLNIRWLCAVCHSQWHAINGEAKNP